MLVLAVANRRISPRNAESLRVLESEEKSPPEVQIIQVSVVLGAVIGAPVGGAWPVLSVLAPGLAPRPLAASTISNTLKNRLIGLRNVIRKAR
jgi:hypothetical protein